ncbi:hypothetical protein H8356DRAFT_256557 [Neocallimastix lanati (nom. inval.)]|jgi:chitin synthase|uniref:chitin synthase n=1 Tax=Neocallimastix californiae TaxID=1754190 RepID=A0A1Y2F1Y4_9FUNG|nr:hypothetical protein H8356DRAFT_256557 [Neocallimastix sp. JGI-2020a]ORY77880.1 hypothetical protein LY90DRAFT_698418 [Neocallimastix californiae]|eukprot:ORY77880.1 hypothetical protein LY90DRAFT_698418 [Neocallimastix californiae]
MSGYPTNGPGAGYPQDGRRPVIINAYPNNGSALPKRNQTLTRPDRQPTLRRTLMRNENRPPPAARAGATSGRTLNRPTNLMPIEDDEEEPTGCWTLSSRILTFWAIGPVRALFGVGKDKAIIQAWREKMALCIIIFFCWCLMGFFTVGLQPLLCPSNDDNVKDSFLEHDSDLFSSDLVLYKGRGYSLQAVNDMLTQNNQPKIPDEFAGKNITPLFRKCADSSSVGTMCNQKYKEPCAKIYDASSAENECKIISQDRGNKEYKPQNCLNEKLMELKLVSKYRASFKWDEIKGKGTTASYTVFNGFVFEKMDTIVNENNKLSPEAKKMLKHTLSTDGTRYFLATEEMKNLSECLIQNHAVGFVYKDSMGCGLSVIITWITTIAILGVVLTRFVMAIVFSWFVSGKLAQPIPGNKIRDLHTICLVTAYSEGEEGIRCTLNSLATTTYPDKKQLLFVIADGIIMGSGNDRSTPDICVGMIVEDPKLGKAEPKSYFAIADGSKQHNMARAHAGYYIVDGHKVPSMVIVKCGTPAEAKAAKPGNRGKRDSQLLLMNFLSRVTFDDRMTPLDYDMFKKIKHICGVTPDKFEIVLMVDADTKVLPTSLSYMVTAMINDPMIMGLCGETRIANKTTSWVTWIQVFEYYISHHLGKCFESLFGGVTCLPGCFCMYRIKAPKPGTPNTYVPVLANPDIVEDYSENVVDTLHKKNLLLLGEDRFLTTLMLRNFPKRKMVFITQALCKTIVPDEFKVLLSQRRRWINSTVHNLMELVLVRDLCGTFCFSMQFVVGMELFGTSVLPAAIVFTVYLLIVLGKCIYDGTKNQEVDTLKYVWDNGPIAPLVMLFAVLGLPGILVMLTTQKVIYVLWMFVYLLGLPVWNLVLPVYAFWHFDDFSWGETRKVQGDNGDDHSKKEGKFDPSEVPLKRWHEYEKESRVRESPYIAPNSPYGPPQHSRSIPMGPRPGGPSPHMSPQGQRPFTPQSPGAAARPGGARPPMNNIPYH